MRVVAVVVLLLLQWPCNSSHQPPRPRTLTAVPPSPPASARSGSSWGSRLWGVEYFASLDSVGPPFGPCVRNTSANSDPETCSRPQHADCCFPGQIKQVSEGFGIARVAVEWDAIESTTKGIYGNWTKWDQTFAALRAASPPVRWYGMLGLSNWAAGSPLYARHSPEAAEAFVRWALAAMRRYDSPGAIWELWNEPNTPDCAHGCVGDGYPVALYSALATRLGAAVRAAPDLAHVRLVGPASAGIDIAYLEAFLRTGILASFDAVSVHPYRVGPPETVLPEFGALRNLIDAYTPLDRLDAEGRSPIAILSGEWGYPASTNQSAPHAGLSLSLQAKYLVTSLPLRAPLFLRARLFLSDDAPLSSGQDVAEQRPGAGPGQHLVSVRGSSGMDGAGDARSRGLRLQQCQRGAHPEARLHRGLDAAAGAWRSALSRPAARTLAVRPTERRLASRPAGVRGAVWSSRWQEVVGGVVDRRGAG